LIIEITARKGLIMAKGRNMFDKMQSIKALERSRELLKQKFDPAIMAKLLATQEWHRQAITMNKVLKHTRRGGCKIQYQAVGLLHLPYHGRGVK
jgi:hypothetical protein